LKDFSNYIAKITKGFFSDEKIDGLIVAFSAAANSFYFDNDAEANLIRMIDSMFDKIFFLDECLKFPSHSEILCSIASNSNYLCDIISGSPEFFYLLLNNSFMNEPITAKNISTEYSEVTKTIKTFRSRINFLKSLQRRFILKIGVNDIIFKSSVKKTTRSLSVLASSISKIVFEECANVIAQKYSLLSFPKKYSLCALGKLGGNELNYSSDIDLILFYRNAQLHNEANKTYQELLTETIKLFISTMSEFTDKGNLYRVDFRLRPDGNYAPLCMNVDDMINYYDTRGEDWERQMLIKLKYIAGNKNVFEYFRNFTEKYIYNYPLSTSPILAIKKMKTKIEKLYDIKGNIKTEPGGIRDIEFIIQALQIINGKKIPELRNPNSLKTISVLKKHNLISKTEAALLKKAYNFYRQIEHFLQLMNNNQTHNLSVSNEILAKLSLKLGFNNTELFRNKLAYYQRSVRKFFDELTDENENDSEKKLVFFGDIQKAKINLKFLSSGSGISAQNTFDKFTSNKFDLISDILINNLSHCNFPDRALDNFVKLTKTNLLISSWYSYLNNENLIKDLLKVCELSQFTIENIWLGKELTTATIVNEFFRKQLGKSHEFSVSTFKAILSAQFALGFITVDEMTKEYSEFIHSELIIQASELNYKNDFCLISLGSLSAGEMNLFSDIDLIVVANDYDNCENAENEVIHFLKSIREKLTGVKIDFRLRPEGKNSFLVSDLKSYLKYFRERAGIWEFQTLLKNRFISGNLELYHNFLHEVNEIQKKIPQQRMLEESKSMYNKLTSNFSTDLNLGFDLKKSKGGFLTIDFLTSFLILYEQIDNLDCLKLSDRINLLSKKNSAYSELNILNDNYSFLKKILIWQQVFFNKSTTRILEDSQYAIFSELMNYNNESDFKMNFNAVIKSNSELINRFLCLT